MNKNKVMDCKKLTQIVFVLTCICFMPLSLLAIQIIDIDNFNFPRSQTKGVRIARFDPDAQKFIGIDYYVQPTAADFTTTFKGLAIDGDCNVTIPVTYKLKGFIIRTSGDIKQEDLDDDPPEAWNFWESTDYREKGEELTRTVLSVGEIAFKKGSTVMNKLNAFSKKTKGGEDFQATIHQSKMKSERPLGSISSDKTDNKDERGVLGELATHLTMMHFGYECRFSKYGKNNGFDGVFIDSSDNPELFLVESKNKGRPDGVPTIMRDELSEANIAKKLNMLLHGKNQSLSDDARELLVKTGGEIQEFIDDSPASIFKFAHRVKPDGTCQCLVNVFDLTQYKATISVKLKPESPNKEKVIAVKDLMGQLAKTDEDKAALLLGALPGSDLEKLTLILKALGISKAQQTGLLKDIKFKGAKVKKVLKFDSDEGDSAEVA